MADLERMRLTPEQFTALPEYSHSHPSGVVAGKRWRRLQVHHQDSERLNSTQRWYVGEYVVTGKGAMIEWYQPVIVVRAVSRPEPAYRE